MIPIKIKPIFKKHGLDFNDVYTLDWDQAIYTEDLRQDYDEVRLQAFVTKNAKAYIIVLTLRGDRVRIISFRRANKREERLYNAEKNRH